jgi:hypothetical protein
VSPEPTQAGHRTILTTPYCGFGSGTPAQVTAFCHLMLERRTAVGASVSIAHGRGWSTSGRSAAPRPRAHRRANSRRATCAPALHRPAARASASHGRPRRVRKRNHSLPDSTEQDRKGQPGVSGSGDPSGGVVPTGRSTSRQVMPVIASALRLGFRAPRPAEAERPAPRGGLRPGPTRDPRVSSKRPTEARPSRPRRPVPDTGRDVDRAPGFVTTQQRPGVDSGSATTWRVGDPS